MIAPKTETSCINYMHTFMHNIFTKSDFQELDRNKSEMTFSASEVIIKQGLFVSQIFYLKSGIAKIVLENSNDKASILNFVAGKNFIALPVLGNPDIYPFSVIAVTDCSLCVIRKETIVNIIEKNIKANKFILKQFYDDFIFLYNRLNTLSTRNNHGKLATALLYLAKSDHKDILMKTISRKELAQFASISIESSNKILQELKNDKIIDIKNNVIEILKPELITKLSTVG